jgi:glutaredoxin-like protein NrdH
MTVKVFALSTCPYCRMTRTFLDENDVEYDVVEVDRLQGTPEYQVAVDEVKRLSGGTSFPVVVIGETVVVGFNKPRIAELLGL